MKAKVKINKKMKINRIVITGAILTALSAAAHARALSAVELDEILQDQQNRQETLNALDRAEARREYEHRSLIEGNQRDYQRFLHELYRSRGD